MTLGRGPCSGTSQDNKEDSVDLLCQWIKTKATLSLQVDVKEFKKCCTSDKVQEGRMRTRLGMVEVNMRMQVVNV